MANNTVQSFKEITKTDIASWKKTKSGLREIAISLDDEVEGKKAKYIICKPTRNLLPSITHYGQEKEIEKLNLLLITNCVLGGDMEYLDTEKGEMDVYLAVLEQVGKLMEAKRVTSKSV